MVRGGGQSVRELGREDAGGDKIRKTTSGLVKKKKKGAGCSPLRRKKKRGNKKNQKIGRVPFNGTGGTRIVDNLKTKEKKGRKGGKTLLQN